MAKNESAARTAGIQPAAAETPDTPVSKTEQPDGCAAGFYCYIGPNITGLIQNGTIYRGTRSAALTAAAAAIEKHPLVKSLIVSGDELPEARLKVKRPGNALYQNYRKISTGER